MTDNRKRLKGPHRDEALAMVNLAHMMSREDAERAEAAWTSDDDLAAYYQVCDRVWTALEDTGRFLQIGWFEREFGEDEWFGTTRALHAVADAVTATLVADRISVDDLHLMTRHLKSVFQFA